MSRDIPIIFSAPMVRALLEGRKTQTRRLALTSRKLSEDSSPGRYHSRTKIVDSPWKQTQPGDRLWVRESWRPVHAGDPSKGAQYMADVGRDDTKWRPSIHMTRWASRLTLIVTGVKVERLQDISRDDAIAEGCKHIRDGCWVFDLTGYDRAGLCHSTPETAFSCLWSELHGSERWDSNPFVAAINFRVIKANIDAPEARAA